MGEILGGQFPVFGGLVILVGGAIVFFIGTLHGERRLMINGAVILLVAVLSLVAGLMLTRRTPFQIRGSNSPRHIIARSCRSGRATAI